MQKPYRCGSSGGETITRQRTELEPRKNTRKEGFSGEGISPFPDSEEEAAVLVHTLGATGATGNARAGQPGEQMADERLALRRLQWVHVIVAKEGASIAGLLTRPFAKESLRSALQAMM
ncbi:hypothetical protein MRX96_044027 [Rhipicephalus microplus]